MPKIRYSTNACRLKSTPAKQARDVSMILPGEMDHYDLTTMAAEDAGFFADEFSRLAQAELDRRASLEV